MERHEEIEIPETLEELESYWDVDHIEELLADFDEILAQWRLSAESGKISAENTPMMSGMVHLQRMVRGRIVALRHEIEILDREYEDGQSEDWARMMRHSTRLRIADETLDTLIHLKTLMQDQ